MQPLVEEALDARPCWCERKTASLVDLIDHGPECNPDCDWTAHGEIDFARDWFVFREWEPLEFRFFRLDAKRFLWKPVRSVKWTLSGTRSVHHKLCRGRLLLWKTNRDRQLTEWLSACCESGEELSGICEADSWDDCFPVNSGAGGWLTLRKFRSPCIQIRAPTMELLGAIPIPFDEDSNPITRVFSWESSPRIVRVRYEAGTGLEIRWWLVDFDVQTRTFGNWSEATVSVEFAGARRPDDFGICRWNGQAYDIEEIPSTSFRLGQNGFLSHATGLEVRIRDADHNSCFYADPDNPADFWALGSHTLTRYRFILATQPLTFLACRTLASNLYHRLPDTQTAQQFALCFDRLLRDQIKDS